MTIDADTTDTIATVVMIAMTDTMTDTTTVIDATTVETTDSTTAGTDATTISGLGDNVIWDCFGGPFVVFDLSLSVFLKLTFQKSFTYFSSNPRILPSKRSHAMKNNKPVTIKPDIGPVRPGKYPYGDNDIPEYEIPPATDDIPLPSDLPLVDDPDIPIQEE